MGTSLTGLEIKDTYDGLVKTTDNGPISGTAKFLSDGLGNDSALALSTAAVGIGTAAVSAGKLVVKHSGFQYIAEPTDAATFGNLGLGHFSNGAFIGTTAGTDPVSDILRFGTTGAEKMRITSAGNVGIGTSAPFQTTANRTVTSINGTTSSVLNLGVSNSLVTYLFVDAGGSTFETAGSNTISASGANPIIFNTNSVERARITANGLTFNGDTAAANALDDYEEGTWTPVLRGAATAGTYELSTSNAVYTKIGRQVTISCEIVLAAVITGGGTTYAQITGLPFAKGTGQQAVGSVFLSGVDFTADYVVVNFTSSGSTSVVYFSEIRDNAGGGDLPIAGFSATDTVFFTLTYNA